MRDGGEAGTELEGRGEGRGGGARTSRSEAGCGDAAASAGADWAGPHGQRLHLRTFRPAQPHTRRGDAPPSTPAAGKGRGGGAATSGAGLRRGGAARRPRGRGRGPRGDVSSSWSGDYPLLLTCAPGTIGKVRWKGDSPPPPAPRSLSAGPRPAWGRPGPTRRGPRGPGRNAAPGGGRAAQSRDSRARLALGPALGRRTRVTCSRCAVPRGEARAVLARWSGAGAHALGPREPVLPPPDAPGSRAQTLRGSAGPGRWPRCRAEPAVSVPRRPRGFK